MAFCNIRLPRYFLNELIIAICKKILHIAICVCIHALNERTSTDNSTCWHFCSVKLSKAEVLSDCVALGGENIAKQDFVDKTNSSLNIRLKMLMSTWGLEGIFEKSSVWHFAVIMMTWIPRIRRLYSTISIFFFFAWSLQLFCSVSALFGMYGTLWSSAARKSAY